MHGNGGVASPSRTAERAGPSSTPARRRLRRRWAQVARTLVGDVHVRIGAAPGSSWAVPSRCRVANAGRSRCSTIPALPPEFEVGPFVEVEILLAHNLTYPPAWLAWHDPTTVNSTLVSEPWSVAYWCHGADNGSNANVSFDFALGGRSTLGIDAGTVGVNVSAVLAEVESLMPSVTCWTGPTGGFAGFHFDEANLGSEDGAVGGASFDYNWTVSQYCIASEVRNASAIPEGC